MSRVSQRTVFSGVVPFCSSRCVSILYYTYCASVSVRTSLCNYGKGQAWNGFVQDFAGSCAEPNCLNSVVTSIFAGFPPNPSSYCYLGHHNLLHLPTSNSLTPLWIESDVDAIGCLYCQFFTEPHIRQNFDMTVRMCRDFIRTGCQRERCRYFHPPQHIMAQVDSIMSLQAIGLPQVS